MRRRFYVIGIILFLGAAGVAAWRWEPGSAPTPTPAPTEEASGPVAGMPWFEDVTEASGIDFKHFDSSTDQFHIHETMSGGVAWIDYDNDGWLDLFFVQDGPVKPNGYAGTLPTSKLYRNNGDGTFTDVTKRVGLDRVGYGMGCAVGDFDNDGFDDLAVTYFGGVVLYHNRPDGKGGRHFVDVTPPAMKSSHWATSCAWGDIDGDGLLDLYICYYVDVDVDHPIPCSNPTTKVRHPCPPSTFPAITHRLFRNTGNGTFTDISVSSGIASVPGAPGLAVVMVDLDGDGQIDIYVANDMKPAYLFHNQGGGRFVEKALFSGSGLDGQARYLAGMGVTAGDVDGSGRPSLFVTNYYAEPNILFLNKGKLLFEDWAYPSGLGQPSLARLAFGAVMLDADLDGELDIAVANGHITRNSQEAMGQPFAQEAQLFVGRGKARFNDVSAKAGPYFSRKVVGRGLAWGDYNNDGLPDLVYNHNGGVPALLRNRTATDNNWLRLELIGDGVKSNRNAIGARVEIDSALLGRRTHFVLGGGSYLSASDRRLLIGLGGDTRADCVRVVWPSGRKQEFRNLAARKNWKLIEGKDSAEEIVYRPPQPLR